MADPKTHDVQLYTGKFDLRCSTCKQVMRLEARGPRTAFAGPIYCPYCAAPTVSKLAVRVGYFRLLAVDLGLPDNEEGETVCKQLFELWEPTNGDSHRFMDFARRMIADA